MTKPIVQEVTLTHGPDACEEHTVEVRLWWNRYIPASHWEPEEGGYFDSEVVEDRCPVCGHVYTPSEEKEIIREAEDNAKAAFADSRHDER